MEDKEQKPTNEIVDLPCKKHVGRGHPSFEYTTEIAQDICTRIANGEFLVNICKEPGYPSRDTVTSWYVLNKNGEFARMYARARNSLTDLLAEQVVTMADASYGETMENLVSARLSIDSRKWYCAKVAPKKYGDKITEDSTDDKEIEDKRVSRPSDQLVEAAWKRLGWEDPDKPKDDIK